jgi:Ca-activated chloride channel family protein
VGATSSLIIDHSASMGAVDQPPSRLAEAKRLAISLIDQLPDGGRATVIAVRERDAGAGGGDQRPA